MPHFLIAVARFYEDIADELVRGASARLESQGVTCDVVEVPGALELPAAVRFAIESGRYEGYVALGCVIRGQTTHYDTVCTESARGLNSLALAHMAAIGNGILTVETREQARARAACGEGDKGGAAAAAALRLAAIRKQMRKA